MAPTLEDFDLTKEGMSSLTKKFYTHVIMKNYYTKKIMFNGPINRFFYDILENYALSGEIEKNETWNTESLDNAGDWRHIKQSLYKKHSKYKNQLHITVDMFLKRKGWFTPKPCAKKYGFWSMLLYSLIGMEVTDTILGDKANIFTDLATGFLISNYLESKNVAQSRKELAFEDE